MEDRVIFRKHPNGKQVIAVLQSYCGGYFDVSESTGDNEFNALIELQKNLLMDLHIAQSNYNSVQYAIFSKIEYENERSD